MKNFVKFLSAYEAVLTAGVTSLRFSAEHVSPYYEDEFHANRRKIRDNLEIVTNVLLDWFDENFPKTTAEAAQSDCFSYPAFFAMLKQHPELVESNEDRLSMLLSSLKARGLYGTGLESVPAIDEFVTEKMKLKKEMVEKALAELGEVKDNAVKAELVSVKECLTTRRPPARKAYMELLSLSCRMDKECQDYKHVNTARHCLDSI